VLTSGRQLITILPPTSSLLLILVLMVMLLFPTRQALRVALLAWLLVAWPVLIYLLLHPLEMETPRGRNLPMAYGTALVLIAVLIPVQRGLAGKIERLTSERARLAGGLRRRQLHACKFGQPDRAHGARRVRSDRSGARSAHDAL